jgi:hypothetical protein
MTTQQEVRGPAGARIWYQRSTDPEADRPCFTRLDSYLRSVSSPGCEVEAFARQAERMLGLGVDVIVPAGGYPMLLFAREPSFTIGGATVLNGLPVAVAAAETAIRLSRLNGTGTSRRTAYALPPGEAVADFRSAFTSGTSASARDEPARAR